MKDANSTTMQHADDRRLKRLALAAVIVAVVLIAAFAGYYYWDRYVHIGDQSPLELGVSQLEEAVREDPQNAESRLSLAEFYFQRFRRFENSFIRRRCTGAKT